MTESAPKSKSQLKRIAAMTKSATPLTPYGEALERIAQLERELAEAKRELRDWRMLSEEQAARAVSAEQRLAEVEKDAERYRWIRVGTNIISAIHAPRYGFDSYPTGDKLDAEIDAVLAQGKEKP